MKQIPNIEEGKCTICRDGDGKWKEGRNTQGIDKNLICDLCEKDGWKVATSKNILADEELSKRINHQI